MPEEVGAAPGWADQRADEAFVALPDSHAVNAAKSAYMACLSSRKSPAIPSDLLGAEFNGCRATFRRALEAEHVEGLDELDAKLEALEAEIASGS